MGRGTLCPDTCLLLTGLPSDMRPGTAAPCVAAVFQRSVGSLRLELRKQVHGSVIGPGRMTGPDLTSPASSWSLMLLHRFYEM